MLRYIEDPTGHESPDWPVGYWPDPAAETDVAGFAQSVAAFKADLRAMEEVALDTGGLRQVMGSWPEGHR